MNLDDIFGDPPTIETPRLILRKMRPDDAEDMFAYASDWEVAKYALWEPFKTIDESHAYLAWAMERYANRQALPWGIEDKADRKFIGTCGFGGWRPAHMNAEIGYALSRDYWGRGYMTEAVRAVLDFAFINTGLHRIEAKVLPQNTASINVLEKVGMAREGLLRECFQQYGRYEDLYMYAILR